MHLIFAFRRYTAFLACVTGLVLVLQPLGLCTIAPQKSEAPSGNGKKNVRPTPPTEEERKKAEEEKKRAEEEKNAVAEDVVEKVESNIVNVDTVVYNKKTGQIITGLKKENFAIFENGVKQDITSFATPESPITVTLILEYSRWTEMLGQAAGGGFEPGVYEVVRPVASSCRVSLSRPTITHRSSLLTCVLHLSLITRTIPNACRMWSVCCFRTRRLFVKTISLIRSN
jgi:hypothetical protein